MYSSLGISMAPSESLPQPKFALTRHSRRPSHQVELNDMTERTPESPFLPMPPPIFWLSAIGAEALPILSGVSQPKPDPVVPPLPPVFWLSTLDENTTSSLDRGPPNTPNPSTPPTPKLELFSPKPRSPPWWPPKPKLALGRAPLAILVR